MKSLIVTVLMLFLLPVSVQAADPPLPTDPLAIRNELRSLRKKTDANDKKVRARVDALMKQLQKLQGERDAAESHARGEKRPVEEGEEATATREKMYEQVQKSADKGKGGELDLAEPVREQIVKEYEEDRDPAIKNPLTYQEQTVLVIDLSRREASALIAVMDRFTGIKTLILTGGGHGAPVNLPAILDKAQKMPLTELHIYNFRTFLTAIPESIATFKGLTRLSLFNNSIRKLPAGIGAMKQLKVLHVDVNPLTTILPTVKGLVFLEELGIGKTSISAAEQGQIARLLPNCRMVTQ